jgi:hypothetical protein
MAYTLKRRPVPDGMSNNPNTRLLSIDGVTIHEIEFCLNPQNSAGNYAASANAKMHADYQ